MPDPRRTGLLACVGLLALASSGCLFQSKPRRLFTPPPVQAKPVVLPSTPILEALIIDVDVPSVPEPAEIENWPMPQFPSPPRPPVRTKAPSPPKPEGPPAPPPTAPKITQIFSDDQRREYTRQFDESVDRAKRALDVLGKKNLPPSDQTEVERIKTFLSQAEAARANDLVTAARLARAADLFAKDLLAHVP